jgi:hypothetical protein
VSVSISLVPTETWRFVFWRLNLSHGWVPRDGRASYQ